MADKWSRSREMLACAKRSLAGGVSSPFRAKFPVPLFFEDAEGARVRDVDGNEYVDYALAWGPLILGHRHPAVVAAVEEQARRPHLYGAQHELEREVAERIQRLVPCAERVAFTSSGSEAVQLAMRLARAATGRNLILKFEGHYHGWMDSALISYHPSEEAAGPADAPAVALSSRGQVPNVAENAVVARWNSIEAVEQAFERHREQIAGVILEPVLCNSGCLLPREGYLEGLQALCRRHGALLIFDEVITGFRMDLGGAQQAFHITPDLATLGKALGGGLPLSAVVGRADLLELTVDGGVAFGGTFNGNPLALAAAEATLDSLSESGGEPLEKANWQGSRLIAGLESSAAQHRIPLVINGFGCAFAVHFTPKTELHEYRDTWADDSQRLRAFLLAALERGVYILADGRFYVSTAHTEQDVNETLTALDDALGALPRP